jgi:hypothetical protein
MKRMLMGLLVSVAATGTMLAAQVPSPGGSQPAQAGQSRPTPRDPAMTPGAGTAADTTVTGCLVQGSGPNVFLLKDARLTAAASSTTPRDMASSAGSSSSAAGADASADTHSRIAADQSSVVDRGTTYRLDASGDKAVDFKTHLNHQVSITGKLDGKAATTAAAAAAVDKLDEKALAKFTAASVTKLADTCSAVG